MKVPDMHWPCFAKPTFVLITALLWAVIGVEGAALALDDPVAAARDILADGRYQTALPGFENDQGDPVVVKPEPPEDRSTERSRFWSLADLLQMLPEDVRTAVKILVWVLLALAALALLAYLFKLISGYGRSADVTADGPDAVDPADDSPAMAAGLLAEADRHAARGDWAAAIHLLLLGTWFRLGDRLEARWPVSLTSRELIDSPDLPDPTRAAVARLVRAVEQTRFAGRAGSQALYRDCRAVFVALLGRGAAA